jgi:hypothetical protein
VKGAQMTINLHGVTSIDYRTAARKELYPGVKKRDLSDGANGAKALILEIDAPVRRSLNWSFTRADPRRCSYSQGRFHGVHEYPAGTFIHNPASSAHVTAVERRLHVVRLLRGG